MNHKRRRPKKQRAGCLLCKPWKANGAGAEKERPSDRRKLFDESLDRVMREDAEFDRMS